MNETTIDEIQKSIRKYTIISLIIFLISTILIIYDFLLFQSDIIILILNLIFLIDLLLFALIIYIPKVSYKRSMLFLIKIIDQIVVEEIRVYPNFAITKYGDYIYIVIYEGIVEFFSFKDNPEERDYPPNFKLLYLNDKDQIDVPNLEMYKVENKFAIPTINGPLFGDAILYLVYAIKPIHFRYPKITAQDFLHVISMLENHIKSHTDKFYKVWTV